MLAFDNGSSVVVFAVVVVHLFVVVFLVVADCFTVESVVSIICSVTCHSVSPYVVTCAVLLLLLGVLSVHVGMDVVQGRCDAIKKCPYI